MKAGVRVWVCGIGAVWLRANYEPTWCVRWKDHLGSSPLHTELCLLSFSPISDVSTPPNPKATLIWIFHQIIFLATIWDSLQAHSGPCCDWEQVHVFLCETRRRCLPTSRQLHHQGLVQYHLVISQGRRDADNFNWGLLR